MIKTDRILLGYSSEPRAHSIGFVQEPMVGAGQPIYHDSETPLITVAPTGAGKGVGCIIPTLLTVDLPTIVVDPKGEAFAVTAERRAAIGQKIVCIDPFQRTGSHSYHGGLNPLDLIDRNDQNAVDQATSIASMLAPASIGLSDPFWNLKAQQIITGFLLAVTQFAAARDRHLGTVRKLLTCDPRAIGPVLLGMTEDTKFDRYMADCATQLMWMPDRTCQSVIATATYMLNIFGSRAVRKSVQRTTFDLNDVVAGRAITIYLVIPPQKLLSHQLLLRGWIATLLQLALSRKRAPEKPLLFLIDEAAQLGALDEIRSMVTLLRGYGVITWLFFQSASQLKHLYHDWRTLIENAGTLQVFGFNSRYAEEQALELTGYNGAIPLLGASRDLQVIAQPSSLPKIAMLPNYLRDANLQKLAQPNRLARMINEEVLI